MNSSPPARFRALVVDDNSVVRKMVTFALSQNGFNCDAAVDGEEALQKLKSATYDLLVTDLSMPNKNGHALATAVVGSQTGLTIVVHTAVTEPRMTHDLLARGIDDVVYKPTDYVAFAIKARARVERRRRDDCLRAITATKQWDSPEDRAESLSGADDEPQAAGEPSRLPAQQEFGSPPPSSRSSSVRTSPTPGDAVTAPRVGPAGVNPTARSTNRKISGTTGSRVARATRPRPASSAPPVAAVHPQIDLTSDGPASPGNSESSSPFPEGVEAGSNSKAAVEIASLPAESDAADSGSQALAQAAEQDRRSRIENGTSVGRASNNVPLRELETPRRDAAPESTHGGRPSATTSPAEQPGRRSKDSRLGGAGEDLQKEQARGVTTWLSLVVLFGLAASLFFQMYVTRQQARAVAVLEQLGARLSRSASGDVEVDFRSRDITGALQQLQALRGVTSVDLANSNVSDQDLEHFQKLGGLQVLGLDDTGVTDAGMKHLLRLRRLRQLNVNGTTVTEPQIRELEAAIPGLTVDLERGKRSLD